MSIQRFRLRWDGMTYKVSEPGVESCEVVLAHIYDALRERVARLEREFLNKDQIIASLTATAQLSTVTAARDTALARVAELEVDLESCHTQVSELQASDRAYAEGGADNLSLRLLLADKLATVTAERDAFIAGGVTEELLRKQNGYFKVGKGCVIVREDDYRLTWTTAKPTGAGWYWWRSPHRGDEVAYIFMGGGKNRKRFYVSYLGLDESPPELDHVLGEWAGPIPMPTEPQQARGSSGGDTNHGAGT